MILFEIETTTQTIHVVRESEWEARKAVEEHLEETNIGKFRPTILSIEKLSEVDPSTKYIPNLLL